VLTDWVAQQGWAGLAEGKERRFFRVVLRRLSGRERGAAKADGWRAFDVAVGIPTTAQTA
jgi:hypothetical protein